MTNQGLKSVNGCLMESQFPTVVVDSTSQHGCAHFVYIVQFHFPHFFPTLLLALTKLQNGSMSVICGSRAHLERDVLVKRHPLRNLLMYGFKMCVWLLCVRGVRDTQCGFKLFSRSAARVLFHNLHVERWAFDVDLLYLARYFDMQIVEVPVCWHEIGGQFFASPELNWDL